MHKNRFENVTKELGERYDKMASKVSRRDLLVGTGAFLGGVAVTLAATEIDRRDDVHRSEKEQGLRFAEGIDISYPQGSAEQLDHMRVDFVIVGVNGGRPTDKNPYLANQLKVASEITQNADPSQTGMLPIQLYVNTANPADYYDDKELVRDWPTSEDSSIQHNPYAAEGACDGTDSQACMYVYGWQRASESAEVMFGEAAREAGVSPDAADYTWWLDIETYNSWRESPRDGETAETSNRAVLEGMVAYFHSRGAGVGLYSARNHWDEIIGGAVDESSNLYHLPTWLATGTTPENEVKRILAEGTEEPFTRGGRLAIVQRVEGESALSPDALDYNYAIIPDQS